MLPKVNYVPYKGHAYWYAQIYNCSRSLSGVNENLDGAISDGLWTDLRFADVHFSTNHSSV